MKVILGFTGIRKFVFLNLVLFMGFYSVLNAYETNKTKAILKLDTKGHTSIIRDIIITKNGEIISASDDKTIRVWDIESGREKSKILGEIGDGDEGKIYAIALSASEKYLAVGGFLAKSGSSNVGQIRIYNYQNKKLLKVLKSHNSVVLDLSFSEDDKFLISGSADNRAKIWDVENDFKLFDTIEFHTNDIYATKIIKKNNKYFAISAGFDKKIALYDMQKREILKTHTLNYKLAFLANNKKHIVVCGFAKEIKIYDYNLNLIKTIQSKTMPDGLAYSRDGEFLIAGTDTYPYNVNIYKSKNYTLLNSFKKHTNTTIAVAFYQSKNKTYGVSGGGANYEIYVWDINNLKVKTKINGG
jgi:WD40 repeat protein